MGRNDVSATEGYGQGLHDDRWVINKQPPCMQSMGTGPSRSDPSNCRSRTHYNFGIRNVLLIISVPDNTNISASGWNCHGPMVHAPQYNWSPMRACHAA